MSLRARVIGSGILIPLAFLLPACRKNSVESPVLEVSGIIEAIKIEIRSQSQGIVDEVLALEGHWVAKGDLLCRINADKLLTQIDQADAGIAAAMQISR